LHRVVAPAVRVIALQRATEPHRLDANDRIILRIEIVAAPQRLDRDGVALDALLGTAQRSLDHVAEKRDQLWASAKRFAGSDAIQRRAYFLHGRTFVVPAVRVGHCLPLWSLPKSPSGNKRSAVIDPYSTPIVTSLPFARCNRIQTWADGTISNS